MDITIITLILIGLISIFVYCVTLSDKQLEKRKKIEEPSTNFEMFVEDSKKILDYDDDLKIRYYEKILFGLDAKKYYHIPTMILLVEHGYLSNNETLRFLSEEIRDYLLRQPLYLSEKDKLNNLQ